MVVSSPLRKLKYTTLERLQKRKKVPSVLFQMLFMEVVVVVVVVVML